MLKGVSAVLGVLSLVPGLQFLAPFAVAAGAIALAIDVAVKLATGKGSWTSIGIDAALTFLPGGKILDGIKGVKAAVAGERGLAAGERALGAGEKLLAEGKALDDVATDAREAAVAMEKRICEADPIDVVSGKMVLRQVDVELPGALPLVLARTHLSGYRAGRSYGPAWATTLDLRIEPDGGLLRFADDDGTVLVYPVPTDDAPVLPVEGPRLPLTADDEGWTITRPSGQSLRFGPGGLLVAIGDRLGSRIDVDRSADGVPVELRHTGGYRLAVETERGLVTSLRLREGERWVELVRYGYDDGGRLAAVVNSSGIPLRFRSDELDRIVRWDDRNGTWYGYEYDEQGRCVRTTGADGALSATFAYRPGATTVTDSLGAAKVFEHNDLRQVVRETDALGNVTLSEWDRYDRLLSRTDPLSRTTHWAYDPAGNVLRVDRPDGTSTTADYGPHGQPVRIVDPDGALWRYRYDERGLPRAVTDPAGATTHYRYDAAGHLAAITDALRRTRTVRCDAAGLPIEVSDPMGAITRYRRDAFGRVVEVADPLDEVTSFRWTVEGRLAARTQPGGGTERWRYDGEGNVVEHVDALGQVTRTEIAGFDLVTARTAPDGSRISFGYDTELRLTAVTDPTGLVWRYEYDPAGRLVREVDYDGRILDYGYDPAGQLVERATNGGEPTVVTRDALGNVLQRRTGDLVASFGYDPAGRVVRATTADSEVVLERDVLGRVLAETTDGRTVASRYDLLGRRTWRRVPSGAESSWDYGPDDQPVALRAGHHHLAFGYDAAGREVERALDDAAVLVQAWDPASRLRSQTLRTAAGPVVRSYGYRPDGYLAGIEDDAGARRYELDPAGRVTAVAGTGEQYAYDPAGNLAHSGGERHEYTGTVVRRAGGFRYEHDDRGRMVLRQRSLLSSGTRSWRYRWTAEDRLAEVLTPDGATWRYRYDAFGRRTAKERLDRTGALVERVDFSWDGDELAEQTVAGTSTVWDWAPDGLRALGQRTVRPGADEEFFAIVTDLVGTPTELVDTAGAVVWQARRTLWGGTATADAAVDCPLRFPGQYADAESGLAQNRYRYYDPVAARFASPDPMGLLAGANPVAYVHNPTAAIDPLGLTPCVIPHRTPPRIEDGNLREGWTHIDARHVTGDHPSGPGDLFAPGTTRAQLDDAAQQLVRKGTRVSDPNRQLQVFEKRIKVNGLRDRVRVIVDSQDANRVISIFPVRGG